MARYLTRSGGYIHLLCFSQDVRHPSFAKEMLTACRDVSDPSESLSRVFFCQQKAESRPGLLVAQRAVLASEGGGQWGRKWKQAAPPLSCWHMTWAAELTGWCSWMSSRHFVCFQKICLCESCLPITCPHQPTAFSGMPKTRGLWKWT